jgi:hypothetical protein
MPFFTITNSDILWRAILLLGYTGNGVSIEFTTFNSESTYSMVDVTHMNGTLATMTTHGYNYIN